MATEEDEFASLPLEERLEHKNWKARVSGYVDLAKKLRSLEEDHPDYIKFSYNLQKYVSDTNAAAQEKGLDVTSAFLELAPLALAGKSVLEIMQGIVAKCFNSRPKAKELAISICLQCVEVEKPDVVIEELIGGFSAKIPKIAIGCISAVTQIIAAYGVSVLPVKTIFKNLNPPFAHNDKNIRTEAKNLSIELCKWVKAEILLVYLKDLKPVLLKELEDEWKKVSGDNPKPTRYLRSKHPSTSSEAAGDEATAESPADGTPVQAQPVFDPWEMMDPVDLTKQLPPEFYTNIVSAKWSERKDAIVEFLEEASKVHKVKPADYSELLNTMHKIITKDTNIVCVQNAAKVVTVLAKGLRNNFEPHSKLFITAILEKMKEKKPAVISVLSECADAIYQSTTMLHLHEDILEAMESKNPNVKAEACLFAARCLCYCSPTTLTKPIIKVMVPSLKKRLDDTTPLVRDAASTALGTCLKILGDRALASYFEDIDKNKMAKIQESNDKTELKVPQGSKAPTKDKKATEKKAVAKIPAKVTKRETPEPEEAKEEPKKKAVAKTAPKKTAAKSTNGAANAKTVKKGNTKAKGASKGDDYLPHFDSEPSFSPEDLDVIAAEKFGEEILTRLADPKWKDRVDACNEVKEAMESAEVENINSQLYLHIVMVKPGLGDGNLQALNLKLAVIGFLAKRAPDWGSKCSDTVIATLAEKLGELKLKATATESLFCIAERIQSLHHVASIVMSVCSAHKSLKVQSEGLIWLATALEEFGLKVKFPAFVGYMKTGLASTTPTIKSASMKLLGAFAVFFSSQKDAFKDMLGELNPNIVSKVDKEIQAASENPPSKPARSLKPVKSDGEDDPEGANDNEDGSGGVSLGDMIPRVDISDNFKGALMANLSDKKDWKLRIEALQEIQGILKLNPSITPNLGELPAGLKARLGDTNKNLVVLTLNILATLSAKLGNGLNKIVRSLLPAILTVMSDAKVNVREAAMATLNAWYENLKISTFFDYEMLLTALKTDNPNLRADLMGWISEKIRDVPTKTLPKQELLAIIPLIGSALEDRAAPVRDKAKMLLLTMVDCFGKDVMVKASAKVPGQTLKQILSKLPSVQPQAPMEPAPVREETEKVKQASEPPAAAKSEKIVSSVKSKVPVEPEEVRPFKMGPSREQREKEEKKSTSRCPRWDFETPTADHINYLRIQFEKCMDVALLDKLLDNDVQKLEGTVKIIIGPSCLKGPFEAEIINCVDLILKFIAMKLTEKNNTKLLKLSLDFLRQILEVLSEKDMTISDSEANSIIPFIVHRLGNPNETLRKEIRSIIQLFTHIYTTSKIYMFISVGLISRNSKQKVDCIEVLGELIREQGTGVCTPTPQKAIETIAKSISDADNKTKNAALNCMIYVYKHIGETLFKFVGNISPRDKDLLQEKIKKSGLLASSSPPQQSKITSRHSAENIRDVVAKSTENLREVTPTEQPQPLDTYQATADPVAEPEINSDLTPPEVQPQVFPPTVPIQPDPPRTAPKISGPFSVDIDAIYKKYELKPTVPLSNLKRPSGYEELLKKPTNTTNYQTNTLYARQQYAEDLPAIINNLASQDMVKVDENYRKLEQVIKLQPFEVVGYVDSLVESALIQISTCVSLLDVSNASEQMLRVIRGIISCLINALEIKVLSNKVTRENLRGLFKHLAEFLTNPGLNTFDEGVQVIRALNLLTAKILESVDKNELFAILLTLMLQSITDEGIPTGTTEIYMKCLWRLTRTLEEYIRFVKINTLLHDVDRFFIDYARINRASPKSDDKVFKTAKTIVYHVANALDIEVWDYTDKLARPEQSRVTRIIRNTLNKLNKSQDPSHISSSDLSMRNVSGVIDSNLSLSDGTHTKIFPAARLRAQLNQGMADVGDEKFGNQEVNSRLAQIFTRIGARDNSDQGLSDLYDFMVANPTTDLRPFLKSTSSIFQGYIERGLQSIEREKKNPFKETFVKTNHEDIETRSSYLRLREKTRVVMDLDLPLPPTGIPTLQTKTSACNTPRLEHNGRPLHPPQGIQPRLSPKETQQQQQQQQRAPPKDFTQLRKRLEMASNTSSPGISTVSAMTSAATHPTKLSELRERLLQQQNT